MTLNQLITAVRTQLGDLAAGSARWSDEDLEAALTRAVDEFSIQLPRNMKTVLVATPNSRDLDVSSLSRLLSITAVEWKTGEYPPSHNRYSLWANPLTIHVANAPTAADNVNIFWHAMHQLDPAGSTMEPWAEHLVVTGATGYAAEQAAAQNMGAVSVAGPKSADQWRLFGRQQLQLFRNALHRHGISGRLQTSTLYVPADTPVGDQSHDRGP